MAVYKILITFDSTADWERWLSKQSKEELVKTEGSIPAIVEREEKQDTNIENVKENRCVVCYEITDYERHDGIICCKDHSQLILMKKNFFKKYFPELSGNRLVDKTEEFFINRQGRNKALKKLKLLPSIVPIKRGDGQRNL